MLSLLANIPLPLIPLQILWMNLVTDGLPALALGSDPSDLGVMRRRPRSKGDEILGMDVLPTLFAYGTFIAIGTLSLFVWELSKGSGLATARTVAFSVIIIFQLFHAFNMRSSTNSILQTGVSGNRKLVLAFVLGVALQLAIIYLPLGQELFKTTALEPLDLAVLAAVSLSIVGVAEFRKLLYRRKAAARAA
jgi:Ca2+-transporting ATPase